MKLNLALAQISTKLGDVDANLEKHLLVTKQARQDGADLIVFPELSLTGYTLQDITPGVSRRPTPEDPTFRHLLDASNDIDLVVGFVDEDSRHRFYIASAYLSGGQVLHVHHKVYLPTYGLFDEGRFFAWGDSVRAFDTRFGRMGILICEDFWHASPPYLLWLDGADVLLFTSASPGRGLNDEREARSQPAGWKTSTVRTPACSPVLWPTATGSALKTGCNFWGGATVFDPMASWMAQGPYFEEAADPCRDST